MAVTADIAKREMNRNYIKCPMCGIQIPPELCCTLRDCPQAFANQAKGRDPLLQEREKTHGSFDDHARITQLLKDIMRGEQTYQHLSQRHKESLEMIIHKIGRILAGNPNFKDHWGDIAGYAKLASEACKDG